VNVPRGVPLARSILYISALINAPCGGQSNPATDLSPDTIRDTIAEMVARIVAGS
jgi:hypothetical protein